MARIELAPEVLQDFDRFFEHLAAHEAADPAGRIDVGVQAIDVLASSPLIGRAVRSGKRELVIGASVRGYVALYRFVPAIDTVFVLALRHPREAGFTQRR